jgi:protein SCO1/2
VAARSAFTALLSIGLVLAAAPGRGGEPPPQRVDLALAGWPIGELALVDQIGRPVTQQTLQGQWTFVVLTSGGCSEACAAALAAAAGLYRRIARAAVLRTTQVIVVSLDSRHTPADLYGRLVTYDPRFVAAGGPPAAVAALARDLGVPDNPAALPAEEDAGALWLIDSGGVIRAQLLPPYDVPLLTASYLRTRARR